MKDKSIREIPYSATKNFFWQSDGKSLQITKFQTQLDYNSLILDFSRF